MGFHNDPFPGEVGLPDAPSPGSSGGPGFNTFIGTLRSGAEERVARWASARRNFNARYAIRKPATLYEVQEHYINRLGPANSFPYKDPMDHATTATGTTLWPDDAAVAFDDVVIGVGDGSKTKFQLIKKYLRPAFETSRTIELPIPGTVKSGIAGAEKTITTEWTINTTTGELEYLTAPGLGLDVTAGFEFYNKVRYGAEIDLQMPIETGEFDIGSIPDIPLVEVRSELADPEMDWNGGSKDHGAPSANFSVSLADGKAHKVTPGANIQCFLPDEVDVPDGIDLFVFYNESGSFTLELMYFDQVTSVITMAFTSDTVLDLIDLGGGLKEWQAR